MCHPSVVENLLVLKDAIPQQAIVLSASKHTIAMRMLAKSPLEIFLISCKTRPKSCPHRLPELIVAVIESLLLSNFHRHSPGPGDDCQAHPDRLTNRSA